MLAIFNLIVNFINLVINMYQGDLYMNIDWNFAMAVVIMGLLVVFAVLILLVILCSIMGKFFSSIDKKKNDKTPTPKQAPKKSEEPLKTVSKTNNNDEIGNDVIAAISAAIAVIMSQETEKKPYVIKKIKRAKEARPAWNLAGITENTRPF